jgi:hypothetical protein
MMTGGHFEIRRLVKGRRIKQQQRCTDGHDKYSETINYLYTFHIALYEKYHMLCTVMTLSQQTLVILVFVFEVRHPHCVIQIS